MIFRARRPRSSLPFFLLALAWRPQNNLRVATELQFQVFKAVYQEENDRYVQLDSRAKFYLSLVTFFLGAIAFKFPDLLSFARLYGIPPLLYIATAVFLVLSLLLTILATRIRPYEAACDLPEIIDSFGSSASKDSDFLDERLADYAVAADRNRKENNKVANWLSWAAWLLFAAIFLQLVVFAISLCHPPMSS